MTAQINIPRNAVKALLLFASKTDIRYYLNGVLIEATGDATRMIATNGHMLAIHHSKQKNKVEKPTSLIVPREALQLLGSPLISGRNKRELPFEHLLEQTDAGWNVRSYGNGLQLGFRPIEGKFPDYMKAVPTAPSGEPAQFNADYLSAMGRAAAVFGRPPFSVHIGHNGNGGALVRILGVPEFLAVVMPLRAEAPKEEIEWLAQTLMPLPVKETKTLEPAL